MIRDQSGLNLASADKETVKNVFIENIILRSLEKQQQMS